MLALQPSDVSTNNSVQVCFCLPPSQVQKLHDMFVDKVEKLKNVKNNELEESYR